MVAKKFGVEPSTEFSTGRSSGAGLFDSDIGSYEMLYQAIQSISLTRPDFENRFEPSPTPRSTSHRFSLQIADQLPGGACSKP